MSKFAKVFYITLGTAAGLALVTGIARQAEQLHQTVVKLAAKERGANKSADAIVANALNEVKNGKAGKFNVWRPADKKYGDVDVALTMLHAFGSGICLQVHVREHTPDDWKGVVSPLRPATSFENVACSNLQANRDGYAKIKARLANEPAVN